MASDKINTIGLSAQALDRFLDKLDGESERESRDPKCGQVRVRYRFESIPVRMKHPNGAESVVRMPSRNLSSHGIALLHNAYLHLGTRVALALRDPDGGFRRVTGEVVRCQHMTASIHEIGVRFDDSVDDLVRGLLSDPEDGEEMHVIEPIDPASLQGKLVHVDDSKSDRALIRHHLRRTRIELVSESSFETGLNAALRPLDLLILDFHLDDDRKGTQLATLVRGMGVQAPILIVTSDGSPSTRERVRECRADAMLTKPVDPSRLLHVLGEFLVVRPGGETRTTELPEDPAVAAMVHEFVSALPDTALRLSDAATMDDRSEARRICVELGKGAGAFGFPRLAELVSGTAAKLHNAPSVEECQAEVQRVISACRAIDAA
ncbi:MAG: response regulator [Planctomycetota bacterium]